jgi:DNA-binding CsgD family transcriptional regulator
MAGHTGALRRGPDGLPQPLFSADEWRRMTKTLQLSRRQSEIVDLVIRGQRDKEIMARLNMRKPTVRQHLKDIFKRLGAKHRMEVAYCVFATFRQMSADGRGHHK